jgi:hypothetical protein
LAGVLQPSGLSAREANHNKVHPLVAVDIVGEAQEGVAVSLLLELLRLAQHSVHFPIGPRVVHVARGNVEPTVAIEIGDSHTFTSESGIELLSLESNLPCGCDCRDNRKEAGQTQHDYGISTP